MFVGGLSWDTTDGTLSFPLLLLHLTSPHFPSLTRECYLLFSKQLLTTPTVSSPSLCDRSHSRAEGLRKYFSEFGKVDACTIVRDPDGKSRGFAFLTFDDPSSVNAVMIREHFLDGKAVGPSFLFLHQIMRSKKPSELRLTFEKPRSTRNARSLAKST